MSEVVSSDWLTGVRIRRLGTLLQGLSRPIPYLLTEEATRQLWQICGGSVDEVPLLLGVLTGLSLVEKKKNSIQRTKSGIEVSRAFSKGDLCPLGITLIRAGYFYDQARLLIECGTIDADGALRCQLRLARTGASQLFGVLRCWPEVSESPQFLIPEKLLNELNTVWALLPPPIEMPDWVKGRKQVGDRAEMYSVQMERMKVGATSIVWVARDDDGLGYDVEDRSVIPHRCIEVKGSRNEEVRFFLSENEWSKAQEFGEHYEVQFWGNIDLRITPGQEYAALRAAGYPVIIKNPAKEISDGTWEATAVRWRIVKSDN